MKFSLPFIVFILTVQSLFAQDSLSINYKEPDFILKQPELKYDLSIESRALRDAYYIVLDGEEVRFYTENLKLSERYEFSYKNISISEKTNIIRFDIEYGAPFRRMVIAYKRNGKNNYECTLKLFNIGGKMVYSAHTDRITDFEEIELEREYIGVK